MDAIGRAGKGGPGNGGGSEPGTAPSSQISGIATLWSVSVHVVALPVLLAVVGFWIICRLRLAVDSPKRRHPASITHLYEAAAGNKKELYLERNTKPNSGCSIFSPLSTMTTTNGENTVDPLLPGSQEDMFFTWDSGGSNDEYSSDSFVHTAVELPKYPDGSISEEERQMLLMYVQSNGPTSITSHNGLGSASTAGTNPTRASCEISLDKMGSPLDSQVMTSRGYLETIVEENSDDLRSPSECDDGSLGWGSWDESSELESGSDDDRITVVEVKTSSSTSASNPSVSSCLARARIESVTSNDGSDEDSTEDRAKTPLYTEYLVNKQFSDDESLSSSSLASFVDDAFNCLWESHESVKTDSNCGGDRLTNASGAKNIPTQSKEERSSNENDVTSERVSHIESENKSSGTEDDLQEICFDSVNIPNEFNKNWDVNGSDHPIRLIPSKVSTSDSKDITKDFRCFLREDRYVDSDFKDNLNDIENIPSNFASKNYDSLLSIETAPTYLPDTPNSEKNPKIRCFRIGFGTDFDADKVCNSVNVVETSKDISEVLDEEKVGNSESHNQYEALFSPRQGDVSFGSVRFDGHSTKEPEISDEEQQIYRPDVDTTKNASVYQATVPFPALSTEAETNEGEISSSGKVATCSLSRWQHHSDLQKIDLEEVAGSVARWRHQSAIAKDNLDTKNIERFSNGFAGDSKNEGPTDEELENSPHWNLYKSLKMRNKMSRIRLSDAKNNNFKALGLWENETKVTLPPFGLIECCQNNRSENHNGNSLQKEEELDDLELDMFAVSNESSKTDFQQISMMRQGHFLELDQGNNPDVSCNVSSSEDTDITKTDETRYEDCSENDEYFHPNNDQYFEMSSDQFSKTDSYGKMLFLLSDCNSTAEFVEQGNDLHKYSSISFYQTNLYNPFEKITDCEYIPQLSPAEDRSNTIFESNSSQMHSLLLSSEFSHKDSAENSELTFCSDRTAMSSHSKNLENGSKTTTLGPVKVLHNPEHLKCLESYLGDTCSSLETRIQKASSPCRSLDSDDGIDLCQEKDKKEEIHSLIADANADMKHDDSGYVEDDDEDEEEDILDQGTLSKISEKINGKEMLNKEPTSQIHENTDNNNDEMRRYVNTNEASQINSFPNGKFFNYDDFSEELKDYNDVKAFSSLTNGPRPLEFSSWLLDRELEKVSSKDMMDKLMENDIMINKNTSFCEYRLNSKTENCFGPSFSLDSETFLVPESSSDNIQKILIDTPISEIKNSENSQLQTESPYSVTKSDIENELGEISSQSLSFSEEITEMRKSSTENEVFACMKENHIEFGKTDSIFSMSQATPPDILESSYENFCGVQDDIAASEIILTNNFVNNETETANTGTGTPSADTETPSVNPEVTSSPNNKAWGAEIFGDNNEWATVNSEAAERNILLRSPHEPFHDPGNIQLSDFVVRGLSVNETEMPDQDNEYLQDNANAIQCNESFSSLQMGVGISNGADVFRKPHVTETNQADSIVAPSVGIECNLDDKQIGDDVDAAPFPFDLVTQGEKSRVGEITCLRQGSLDDSSHSLATDATAVITYDDVILRINSAQHVPNDAGFPEDTTTETPSNYDLRESSSLNVRSDGVLVGGSVLSSGEGVSEAAVLTSDVKSASYLHKTTSFTNVATGRDDLVLSTYEKIPHSVEYRRSKSLVREAQDVSNEDFNSLILNHHSKSTPDLRRCNDVLLTSNIPLSALLSKSVSQRIQEYLGESSKTKKTLPQTERSRHYRRICSSTETVVEKAARFEARHRSSSQGSRPLAVTTGVPRNYSSCQHRSGSCPPLTDTYSRNQDTCAMLSPSPFSNNQQLLPRSVKVSSAAQKPTATVRPTTERNREPMLLKSNGKFFKDALETDSIHHFDALNNFANFSMKNQITGEPNNRPEDLFERITGYSKASTTKQPLAEKPPLPPSSNIRGRIASARKDFFERLSQQEANIKKTVQNYETEGSSLERFDRFRKSAREERARLAASHPDLGALEAEVRSSRRRIDHYRKNIVLSKSDSVHNNVENNQEGGPCVVTSNTTASKERTRICTPYRRCTGEIAWASCAKRLEQERLKSRSQGYLETDVDSHLQRTTPAGAPSGPLQPAEEPLRAHSLLSLGEDDPHPEPVAICEELHCSARARSMDFLLDADNREATLPPENRLGSGQGRVKSEHELRIERSLQNLTIPDWYKQSPWSKKPKEGFILRRGSEGSAGESRKRWQGFGSSRTPSASSLTSSSYSQRNVTTPKRMTSVSDWRYTGSLMSSRESLPPASPASLSPRDCTAFQYGLTSLSRWNSSRLSTNSAPLSAWSVHRSFRQPYLGWRAATASSAQTPSSGGSRSSPGMSPAASTPIYGSRPVSPRRPSTHDYQSRDSATLRPDSGDTTETNRISPLALYDNTNGVFFSNTAELMVPKSFTEDVSSKVKIHTGMYDDRLRSGQWPEIRRDRYSYTQSLCNSATLFSPPGVEDENQRHQNPLDSMTKEDRWAKSVPPRVWMESSFVGTKKNSADSAMTSNIKPRVISDSRDQADDKSSTSFSRSTAPSSSFRSSCAPPRQMDAHTPSSA